MGYWIIDFSERVRRSPLLKIMFFWRNLDRAHPFLWLILLTILFFVIGIYSWSILMIAGSSFLLFIFIVLGLVWVKISYG